MHPNLVIGNTLIPSWYTLLVIGIIVPAFLVIYLKPPAFSLSRREVFLMIMFITIAGLFGARLLFMFLHPGASGGYAYFGGLLFLFLAIWIYSTFKRQRFLPIIDYVAPFLMLSQAIVRVGCLMAGCCYGKPTCSTFGVIFKTVDKTLRHPTQAYSVLLLLAIYAISRFIYEKDSQYPGYTLSIVLIMYGAGRFFIEFLRVDSPIIFLNITMAQITCLALILAGVLMRKKKRLPA